MFPICAGWSFASTELEFTIGNYFPVNAVSNVHKESEMDGLSATEQNFPSLEELIVRSSEPITTVQGAVRVFCLYHFRFVQSSSRLMITARLCQMPGLTAVDKVCRVLRAEVMFCC